AGDVAWILTPDDRVPQDGPRHEWRAILPAVPEPTDDQWAYALDAVRAFLVTAARTGTTVTYGEVATVPGTDLEPSGPRSLAAILRAISTSEDEAGRGLLTVVVVRRRTGLPGEGFFRLAAERGRDISDPTRLFELERQRV